jgi:hypothetical protein
MSDTITHLEQSLSWTVPILRSLKERGVLDARDCESGRTASEHLLEILRKPRAQGLEAADIYCSVLERLHNPCSNTQLVNIPFADGRKKSDVCVCASRLFVLISQKPGEYVRIAEELSSTAISFLITVRIMNEEHYRAKSAWLRGNFGFERRDEARMAIRIAPDSNALARAILEGSHKRFSGYNFDGNGLKNSRSAIDVLCQSALMNYALQGCYDSKTDSSRMDQSTGISFNSIGYLSLDNDILGR